VTWSREEQRISDRDLVERHARYVMLGALPIDRTSPE